MKKCIACYRTLKELDKAVNKKVANGYVIKDLHVSQSPFDQPYVVVVTPDNNAEIHMMVGFPIDKKPSNCRRKKKKCHK